MRKDVHVFYKWLGLLVATVVAILSAILGRVDSLGLAPLFGQMDLSPGWNCAGQSIRKCCKRSYPRNTG